MPSFYIMVMELPMTSLFPNSFNQTHKNDEISNRDFL